MDTGARLFYSPETELSSILAAGWMLRSTLPL
jgi:hypothetical protein